MSSAFDEKVVLLECRIEIDCCTGLQLQSTSTHIVTSMPRLMDLFDVVGRAEQTLLSHREACFRRRSRFRKGRRFRLVLEWNE